MIENYDLKTGAQILDIGCAKGFLVEEFNNENMDAWGIDISRYAIDNSVCGPNRCVVRDARDLDVYDTKQFDLVVSITTLHNLEIDDLGVALREIDRIAKNAYITVDAWRNEEEARRMLAWNLTAKTMMHVDEWKKIFDKCRYTGDYFWFTP